MKKRVFEAEIQKSAYDVVLKIKVAPEIETYFKNAGIRQKPLDYIERSAKWLDKDGNGLQFYIKDEKLSGKVPSFSVMDNFGNGLMDNQMRINLALLRTVGASDPDGISIRTNDLLSFEEIKVYIQKLADWTRDFYELELRDHVITSSINIENINA